MTVSCNRMTSGTRVLRKHDLSPNKITSVGNSVPAFDHLIFVAGSHSTVSKHRWLFFSETKFSFTVSIRIYGRISPCCSPVSCEPHFSNTFANACVDMKNPFITIHEPCWKLWICCIWECEAGTPFYHFCLCYSILSVFAVKFPTSLAQNNKSNKICWFACFALIINLLQKRRYFTQVKEFIAEKITCQWYTW